MWRSGLANWRLGLATTVSLRGEPVGRATSQAAKKKVADDFHSSATFP
jgi:hypothetical protein